METVFHSLFILLSFVAISHTQPLLAGSFPISPNFAAVFNFGDSNSDTGELTSGLGFRLPPPNGQSFVFKPPSTGRFCDGRLIVDFLSNSSFLNPILFLYFLYKQLFYVWLLILYTFTNCVPRQFCYGYAPDQISPLKPWLSRRSNIFLC